MAFQKGQPRPPGAGRKPGSKNKKKIVKVAEYLAEQNINPAEEILRILAEDRKLDKKDQKISALGEVEIWFDLLSYCQAKPKEELSGDDDDNTDDALLEKFENVTDETFLKIVKDEAP